MPQIIEMMSPIPIVNRGAGITARPILRSAELPLANRKHAHSGEVRKAVSNARVIILESSNLTPRKRKPLACADSILKIHLLHDERPLVDCGSEAVILRTRVGC